MGRWFRAAWRRNTIISGFLAIGIWSLIGTCILSGITVPDGLWIGGGAVTSFFLKAKVENGG